MKRVAILFLIACGVASATCCGSPAGQKLTKITETVIEKAPCLVLDPPKKPPLIPCPPAPATCEDKALNDAILLDYLARLEKWLELYALPSCKER